VRRRETLCASHFPLRLFDCRYYSMRAYTLFAAPAVLLRLFRRTTNTLSALLLCRRPYCCECLFVCLFVCLFAVVTLAMGQVMVGSQIYSRKVISISVPILGTSIHVPRALCSVWSQIRNISMILLLVVYGTTSVRGVWHQNGACSQKCAEISELRYVSKYLWFSLLGYF